MMVIVILLLRNVMLEFEWDFEKEQENYGTFIKILEDIHV